MKNSHFITRHPVITTFVFISLLATSVGIALSIRHKSTVLVRPKVGPIVEAIYGIGAVTAKRKYTFRVGVTKSLKSVLVSEGDSVKKGQTLLQLDDGIRIQAPFAGTVTSLPYFSGENVPPQAAVLELQDLDSLYIEASLEQQGAIRVKRKMPVKLLFESIRGKSFDGIVDSIYPKQNQFLVHISVKNLPPEVLPGMTADIAIQVAKREEALLVPAMAIQSGQVLVLRDNRRKKVEVEIGSIDGEWAEVINNSVLISDQIYLKK